MIALARALTIRSVPKKVEENDDAQASESRARLATGRAGEGTGPGGSRFIPSDLARRSGGVRQDAAGRHESLRDVGQAGPERGGQDPGRGGADGRGRAR